MDSDYELLQIFLWQFFNYENYFVGISNAKQKIASQQVYRQNWLRIASAIRSQSFLSGQPLRLIHLDANQVLEENSDQEAYVWLEKMVKNIERTDDVIEKY